MDQESQKGHLRVKPSVGSAQRNRYPSRGLYMRIFCVKEHSFCEIGSDVSNIFFDQQNARASHKSRRVWCTPCHCRYPSWDVYKFSAGKIPHAPNISYIRCNFHLYFFKVSFSPRQEHTWVSVKSNFELSCTMSLSMSPPFMRCVQVVYPQRMATILRTQPRVSGRGPISAPSTQ